MSTIEETPAADHLIENGTTNSIKVLVMGVDEAADVLNKFHAQRILPVHYALVAGDIEGSYYLTINYPRSSVSANGKRERSPENFLAQSTSILSVARIETSVRNHVRLVTDMRNPHAAFLQESIETLGGDLKKGRILRLTADPETTETVLSYVRGTPGLVDRAKVNAPFTSIAIDVPQESRRDVDGSAEFSPEAARSVMKIFCWPEMERDAEIIKRLKRHGLEITSIGSRIFDSPEGDMQELTIMMHGSTDEKLKKVRADIMTLGVRHIDAVEEEDAAQYFQIAFPYGMRHDIMPFTASHNTLSSRGEMTSDAKIITRGTIYSLPEAADVRRALTDGGIPFQQHPVIEHRSNGLPLRSPEYHSLGEDSAAQRSLQELLRRDLTARIKRKQQDL